MSNVDNDTADAGDIAMFGDDNGVNGNREVAAIGATASVFCYASSLALEQSPEPVPGPVPVVVMKHIENAKFIVEISHFMAKVFQRFAIAQFEDPLQVGFENRLRQHLGQLAVLGLAFAQFSFGLFALGDIMQHTLGSQSAVPHQVGNRSLDLDFFSICGQTGELISTGKLLSSLCHFQALSDNLATLRCDKAHQVEVRRLGFGGGDIEQLGELLVDQHILVVGQKVDGVAGLLDQGAIGFLRFTQCIFRVNPGGHVNANAPHRPAGDREAARNV